MNKKTILTIVVTFMVTVLISVPITAVFAEQSGSTPESGVTSRIRQVYDALVDLAYGDEGSGGWGDFGAMWNRIYSAAVWTPSGTATSEDVVAGETFYGSSRTQLTGTAQLAQDFELQALVEWDDYEGPDGSGDATEDYIGEESMWTNTLPLSGGEEVWKDERTGLYWSHVLSTSTTNVFPNQDHSTCPFFGGTTDAEKIAARKTYDGLTPACGDAINACGALQLDRNNDGTIETDWYLPTQKELMQGYIDGIWNQTNPAFTTTNFFWSSSEVSYGPTRAWGVGLYRGYTYGVDKTSTYAVRCVARDLFSSLYAFLFLSPCVPA